MMDIHEFTRLVEKTMQASGDLNAIASNLSRPCGNLISQFGPLTDRITKQDAIDKAVELWNANYNNETFVTTLKSISDQVSSLATQTTNSSVMSMGALNFLSNNFESIMNTVLANVKPVQSKMSSVLLATMDSGITAGLALVPVAGPFIAPLTSAIGAGVSSALMQASDPNSELGQLAAQKGLATLVVAGIGIMVKKNEDAVLKNCDQNTPFTKMMLDRLQTQNQQIAVEINDLKGESLTLPNTMRSSDDRSKYYLDETKTLSDFKTKTSQMYKEFYRFIEDIINLGITASFSDSTSIMQRRLRPQVGGNALDDHQMVALLILGYYHTKNWTGPTKKERIQNTEREISELEQSHDITSKDIDNRTNYLKQLENSRTNDKNDVLEYQIYQIKNQIDALQKQLNPLPGEINKKRILINQLTSSPAYKQFWTVQENISNFKSAHTAYKQATGALSKSDFIRTTPNGVPNLTQMESAAKKYFSALKSALVADITSGMSNATLKLDLDEMTKMWKLYIGANLIVNQALRDAALKTESKLKRFTTFIKPKTASTLAEDIYVKMIEDAGFIKRHKSNTLNDEEKRSMASERKLRWRDNVTSSPSDAERAMLLTFCTIVAFTLDVSKISLGFVSWDKTKDELGNLCQTISLSRI